MSDLPKTHSALEICSQREWRLVFRIGGRGEMGEGEGGAKTPAVHPRWYLSSDLSAVSVTERGRQFDRPVSPPGEHKHNSIVGATE